MALNANARRARFHAVPGETGQDRDEATLMVNQTQPVGLGRPATLQAPLAGPLGNSS